MPSKFPAVCAVAHPKVMAGKCPWCGRELIKGRLVEEFSDYMDAKLKEWRRIRERHARIRKQLEFGDSK